MTLFDKDSSDLLDDHALDPNKQLGAHYPPYLKWVNFCSLMVALYALGGVLLFGTLVFEVVPDLLFRIWYSEYNYRRVQEALGIVFILGSFACCACLLLGCWRAYQYRTALRSATFVGDADADRWLHASAAGNRLWRVCAGATLALVLGWGPLLIHTGYDEIDRYLWDPDPPAVESTDMPNEGIPVEEATDVPPQEAVGPMDDLDE